ncbi:arginine deiminase [Oxobacter pfennigii]|uniref:Arginine deiminase n=1 Tax=Oxobacter pfennigii TaxID=36849 RepID=A0A0P8YRP5_9CLOT|nr:arginine deiminase [Oxobacter pfennigii]KPU42268.1 arginine deiminase [Oxobacter pfennigii]
MINEIKVSSEIGKLKAVLVHRPGPELDHLVPRYLENLLFDEIPWLKRAREEHDDFVEALGTLGAQVYYTEKLVEEIIEDKSLKEELINEHLKFSTLFDKEVKRIVHDYIMGLDNKTAVETIIAGLSKDTVRDLKSETSFSDLTMKSYPFYLDPMPSMYFTRDHGTVINKGLLVSQMFNFARRRETIFLRFLHKNHPLFKNLNTPLWFEGEIPTGIEGGDVLVLNKDTLIIGFSERTTESAIESVAHMLLIEKEELKQIIVIEIPAKRAYMHLDTVFTVIDYDKFIIYPGIKNSIHTYRLYPGKNGNVRAKAEESLEHTLSDCLGLSSVKIINSGGDNSITAAREQWSDSTNTFVIAPGSIITYNRNEETNKILRNLGLNVIEVEASELVRGRGGPHCMTMPLLREDI